MFHEFVICMDIQELKFKLEALKYEYDHINHRPYDYLSNVILNQCDFDQISDLEYRRLKSVIKRLELILSEVNVIHNQINQDNSTIGLIHFAMNLSTATLRLYEQYNVMLNQYELRGNTCQILKN